MIAALLIGMADQQRANNRPTMDQDTRSDCCHDALNVGDDETSVRDEQHRSSGGARSGVKRIVCSAFGCSVLGQYSEHASARCASLSKRGPADYAWYRKTVANKAINARSKG